MTGKRFPNLELRATIPAYFYLPEYFHSEKYYTMGPGIDFPLIMQYSAVEQQSSRAAGIEIAQTSANAYRIPHTEYPNTTDTENGQPYFYFLNGHGDVTYLADANFTPEEVETYEYSPWGVLLTQASKNNLLYTAREFDFETDQILYRTFYYTPILAINIGINIKYFLSALEVSIIYGQLFYQIRINSLKVFPLNKGIIVKSKQSHDDYIAFVECCAGGCNTRSRCEKCGGHWSVVCYGTILGLGPLWCEAWCLP